MAINKDKIRQRLDSYSKKGEGKSSILKLTQQQHTVRIVPWKDNPEDPFIFAYFYYGMNGKTILSPFTIGEPDPIVEYATKLQKTGNTDDWKLGKSLMPKRRVYVPVIDRDDEEAGVKFWGFGKGIQEELSGYFLNQEYGDISDPETGTDLIISHKTAAQAGNEYGTTGILPKRKSSVLSMDAKKVKQWLTEQPDFFDIYKIMPYDELKIEFDKYLSGEDTTDDETQVEVETEETDTEVNEIVAKFRKKVAIK